MRKHTQPQNFESAVADLEATIANMESGQLPLDQSLASYQHGMELLQFCRRELDHIEQKIRILDESQTLQPFSNQDE
jgi:exodeoxyribonuclease VII small subunit